MIQGFSTIKDLDENLAWLSQKTEELKHNKLFPHTYST